MKRKRKEGIDSNESRKYQRINEVRKNMLLKNDNSIPFQRLSTREMRKFLMRMNTIN